MNLSKRASSALVLSLSLFVFISTTAAQSDNEQRLEPSYEITLHVVIGSNDTVSQPELPAGLSNVRKHLRNNFSFSSYRLANTFLGRISNSGNIEYKSVSNILGEETDAEPQTFLEWSLGPFRTMQNGFQAARFRFGARVPVRTVALNQTGGAASVTNYEAVGLTTSMIGLPANIPTLIGTISLPKTSGTIFLVATVKTAEL